MGSSSNSGNNSWLDSTANALGISSNSLGLNTAEDKAKRAAQVAAEQQATQKAAQDKADAEAYAQMSAQNHNAEWDQAASDNTPSYGEVNSPTGGVVSDPRFNTPQYSPTGGILGAAGSTAAAETPSAFSSALAGIRHGATSAYQGALKNLATPKGMETLAGVGAGLGSMYLNNQGTKAATAGQDQSQALYQQAANANADLYRGVNDSPEQLAQRQQALQGLSDRASMGLTPEDQAALQGIQRQSANQFKAANATIGQDMSRRGMANSGLGLAQSMGAADQAQQAQALAGQNTAAQSFAAKQGALNNLAQQSGNALSADYTRQIGKAGNLANVNQFNAQQQAQGAVAKGQIQQGAKAAQGQGVLDITKGAIQSLNPNKNVVAKPAGT